jgi:hypothetical protein
MPKFEHDLSQPEQRIWVKFDPKRGEFKGTLWNSIANVHKVDIALAAWNVRYWG